MNFIPLLFYSYAFFLLVAYILSITIAMRGIKANKKQKGSKSNKNIKPDIIIAYHNEEKKLPALIKDLLSQTHKQFRVLWVNDSSTDNSETIIRKQGKQLDQYLLNNPEKGKKQAIRYAIRETNAPLWLFTDADCRLPCTWVSDYITHFENQGSGLYFGSVIYNANIWLEKIFALEFLSLTGTGAGLALKGMPVYMNGANYAITSDLGSAYNRSKDAHLASGDDVFLLHTVKKHFGPEKIKACPDRSMIVKTASPTTLKTFIKQRMRWGGKATAYRDWHAQGLAILVFSITSAQLASFFFIEYWLPFIMLWLGKIITDFIALHTYSLSWKQPGWVKSFFIMAPLYPFYIFTTAMLGLISPANKWLK